MKPLRIWVLVADGAHARIVRNAFHHSEMGEPLEELVFSAPHKRLREIMADKPGRAFASADSRSRSAMEYRSDPVHEEQQAFAGMLVSVLEEHRLASDFDRLAIIAAPRMLGDLRDAMPAGLSEITVAEVPKDLTKLTDLELREAIAQLEVKQVRSPE